MTTPDDTPGTPTKQCSKCGAEYPATTENFLTRLRSPDRLSSLCKYCIKGKRRRASSRADALFNKPEIIKSQHGECYVCKFFCPPIMVIHHIVPVANGGHGWGSNLVGLCPNCHAIVHHVKAGSANDEARLYGVLLWAETFMTIEQVDVINRLILGIRSEGV